jgi:cleavage and polyadenylation specificity factor subunit 3
MQLATAATGQIIGPSLKQQRKTERKKEMEDEMKITPLGSGQEVGRSCHVVKFRGITVMLDIGM